MTTVSSYYTALYNKAKERETLPFRPREQMPAINDIMIEVKKVSKRERG